MLKEQNLHDVVSILLPDEKVSRVTGALVTGPSWLCAIIPYFTQTNISATVVDPAAATATNQKSLGVPRSMKGKRTIAMSTNQILKN